MPPRTNTEIGAHVARCKHARQGSYAHLTQRPTDGYPAYETDLNGCPQCATVELAGRWAPTERMLREYPRPSMVMWRDDLRRDPDWARAAYMVGVVAFIGVAWCGMLWLGAHGGWAAVAAGAKALARAL